MNLFIRDGKRYREATDDEIVAAAITVLYHRGDVGRAEALVIAQTAPSPSVRADEISTPKYNVR